MASSRSNILASCGFHEWLCKTNFSFLMGASHPVDIVRTAHGMGYQSITINDFDGVYGIARSYRELTRLKAGQDDVSLKLNYGAEIHFDQDHDLPVLLQDTLVLVAKNWHGYKNLCDLLTYAHREGKSRANIPVDYLLSADVSGLFAIQPMRGRVRSNKQRPELPDLFDHFNGDFYFALSRHFHPSEDQWIKPALGMAKSLGAGCLLSQDVFFHYRSEKYMSDLMHAIRTNRVFDECKQHMFPNGERSFHSLEEIPRFFSAIPGYEQALKLSYELNQQCEFSLSQLSYHYPQEMIPDNHTAHSYLEKLAWEGVAQHYGKTPPEKIIQLIHHELELIRQLDFADYFLTVWDIVRWARSQDILCQGRGSAANSAVCFVLGITSVDPTLFDLLFERFISMERGDPPDIDVDFEHERREEVIQYIYSRYGRDRAAMVANVVTFRNKGAMRAVGKALGIDEDILSQSSNIARSKLFRSQGIEKIITEAAAENSQAIPWTLWVELTRKLIGFPRHMGIHSGGFMLSDKPLSFLLPQEPSTMEGRTVIQWSKEDIEGLGFFKIDVLSLGMLTAVRKCFDYIYSSYGRRYNMHNIPADDAKTYAMIQRAETVGTFQIESRAQMSMLPRLKPETFYDLVIEVAIIRPGPIQGKVIHPYLARREGLEPVTFPDKRLEPILKRTLGVAIFQEQAMRIAIAVGDFTAGEANELRKNIGAWNVRDFDRDVNPILAKLKRGMEKNGIEQEFIEQIMGQMNGFSEYGFPESHAVSFALIAYVSSYLKCHYPAEFYVAVLNSQPMGFYSPHALLQSARRDDVEILPVSINMSEWDNKLEKQESNGQACPYAIRLGFRLVNALSESAVKHLLKVRTEVGAWQSLEHFIETTRLYRDDFTALASAKAFDEFGIGRSDAIWLAEAVPYRTHVEIEERKIHWKQESAMDNIQRDFRAFNTCLQEHPVNVIKNEQWSYAITLEKLRSAKQLESLSADRDVFVFGMVLVKQAPGSAKGMVFITLEDETGFINLVFSPDVYTRFYRVIERQPFLCVVGKLQKAGDYHSILVKRVFESIRKSDVVSIDDRTRLQKKEAYTQKELVRPRIYK